ncbi:MAG: DUF4393 domain-containing protein [Candidatus Aminicenantes bacterium]|nr:DUF4393 domain-containing protein [Candidatus Aminicenantes bacterium]
MPESEDSTKKELIKAGVEFVKTVYDDALHPIAAEAGKALGTLGKAVNVALAPLLGLVWSGEQIVKYVSETIGQKLRERNVPIERIQTPDPDIAVPALAALRYSKLRENYANLLATSMDSAVSNQAHPAFVEILKQLTPDEAKIIEFLPRVGLSEPLAELGYTVSMEKGHFTIIRHIGTLAFDAKCDNPDWLPKYVDNLCRLGLTEIPPMTKLAEDFRYDRIKELDLVKKTEQEIPKGSIFDFTPKMIGLTVFGGAFRDACVTPPNDKSKS